MKQINTYIIEKLHLNKDIEVDNNPLEVITGISGLHGGNFNEDIVEKFNNIINNWIDKYNIKSVECIIDKDTYERNKSHLKSFENLYRIDDSDFKYFSTKTRESLGGDDRYEIYIYDIIGYKKPALYIKQLDEGEEDFSMIFLNNL